MVALPSLPGPFAQIVILGCHMDSTAARDGGFDPLNDAAPGGDDDATGIAATLAVARQLWSRGRCLRHTVRFCFFNAEESGLVGSRAHAAAMKAANAPIKAVICADMIGFNSDAERTSEIHAGATDPAVRDLSVPIADRIAAAAAALGTSAPRKSTAARAPPEERTATSLMERSAAAITLPSMSKATLRSS